MAVGALAGGPRVRAFQLVDGDRLRSTRGQLRLLPERLDRCPLEEVASERWLLVLGAREEHPLEVVSGLLRPENHRELVAEALRNLQHVHLVRDHDEGVRADLGAGCHRRRILCSRSAGGVRDHHLDRHGTLVHALEEVVGQDLGVRLDSHELESELAEEMSHPHQHLDHYSLPRGLGLGLHHAAALHGEDVK